MIINISRYAAVYWHLHCIKAYLDEDFAQDLHAFLETDASLLWSFLGEYRSVRRRGQVDDDQKDADQITTLINCFEVTIGFIYHTLSDTSFV